MITTEELERLYNATPGGWRHESVPDLKGTAQIVVSGSGDGKIMVCECYDGGEELDATLAELISHTKGIARELIAARKVVEAARAAKDSLGFAARELAAQAHIPQEDEDLLEDRLTNLTLELTAYDEGKGGEDG